MAPSGLRLLVRSRRPAADRSNAGISGGATLADRLSRPRQRRCPPAVFVARIAAPAMGDQLFDELHGIRRQEALRVPGSDGPSSDRRSAMHHHRRPDTRTGNPYRRWNHGNTVAGPGQCDQRLRQRRFRAARAAECARSGRRPRTSHATRSLSRDAATVRRQAPSRRAPHDGSGGGPAAARPERASDKRPTARSDLRRPA